MRRKLQCITWSLWRNVRSGKITTLLTESTSSNWLYSERLIKTSTDDARTSVRRDGSAHSSKRQNDENARRTRDLNGGLDRRSVRLAGRRLDAGVPTIVDDLLSEGHAADALSTWYRTPVQPAQSSMIPDDRTASASRPRRYGQWSISRLVQTA